MTVGRGDETRHEILSQALALASTEGLEGLTIGHLASAVGMSKSGLYAHFKSKEQLQLQVLEEARERFIDKVVSPALKEPRGEPRVRAIFELWLKWDRAGFQPGGCIFQAAANEMDDRPGPVRDFLVRTQLDWLDALAGAARIASEEGHFRVDLDAEVFAYELHALFLAFHQHWRLLRDEQAEARVRSSFEALIARSRSEQAN